MNKLLSKRSFSLEWFNKEPYIILNSPFPFIDHYLALHTYTHVPKKSELIAFKKENMCFRSKLSLEPQFDRKHVTLVKLIYIKTKKEIVTKLVLEFPKNKSHR